MSSVSMEKFDLEALDWRLTTKYLTEAIFGDIFTLNADSNAWKLLKMALEIEYMME